MWWNAQLGKLQEYVKDCGGALPAGWSVRRIRCFGDRHRPLYVAPEVSQATVTLQRWLCSTSCLRKSTLHQHQLTALEHVRSEEGLSAA